MNKDVQRLSQLVMTFGPGAMMDLPTRSVIVGGLDRWHMTRGTWEAIIEERLALKLQRKLSENGRFPTDARLTLRTPPKLSTQPGAPHDPVEAVIFPTWFVTEAEDVGEVVGGRRRHRRRRMVKWSELETPQRRKWRNETGRAMEVTPIRFVAACKKGHIEDIDWRWVVHADRKKCRDPMYLVEYGTSADSRSTEVRCDCGEHITFEQAFRKGRLGRCHGKRPWLGGQDTDQTCAELLDLLTRTATNTYFAQTATSISLPAPSDEVAKVLQPFVDDLAGVQSIEQLTPLRVFEKLGAALRGISDADAFAALMRLRDQAEADAAVPMKVAEFDILTSGAAQIGENTTGSRLYAETLRREGWENPDRPWPEIQSVVAVHRLREVTCLYGFTRFEPAPPDFGDDLEEISIATEGAAITLEQTWLPAIEQFGEGIFVQFDADWVDRWLQRPATIGRTHALEKGTDRYSGVAVAYPGHAYVMLHTIAHALLSELALECGYPSSSVKERVYAVGKNGDVPTKCGILIYTAATGAQGTLGGLVALAPQIGAILEAALEKMGICSSDPVCADHDPSRGARERSLLGAACHSCLLLAETSCESRNFFLDRSLVVETMAQLGAAAFEED